MREDPSAPARFGIEEEAFLLDRDTLDLIRQVPPRLLPRCHQVLGAAFAEEMFQCQAELVSPVFRRLREAAGFLVEGRRTLAALAAEQGLVTLVAPAHPFSRREDAEPTALPHYRLLFEDYAQAARNSLLCGLHVHVEVAAQIDRVRLLEQVLPWLPPLLALSAASPFWRGADSGLASYRRALSEQWPRMGIPPPFADEREFQAHLRLLLERGLVREPGHAWWFIRPSARYPTLELRVTDACPRVADALCIAGLFRAALGQARALLDAGAAATDRALLAENYWQAQRHGCGARFLLPDGAILGLEAWLQRAWAACPMAVGEDDDWAFRHACRLAREGGSSDRQRRALQAHRARCGDSDEALRLLVLDLLEENREQPDGLP